MKKTFLILSVIFSILGTFLLSPSQVFAATDWTIVTPNPLNDKGGLYSTARISADNIWAVGDTPNSEGTNSDSYILHWTGSTWDQVVSPTVPGQYTGLSSVSAVNANDIWAVGGYPIPVTMHWDGTSWQIVTSPTIGNGRMVGVAAIANNDVWTAANVNSSFILSHWDGAAWTNYPTSGLVPGDFAQITGISAVSTNDIWAVGDYSNNGLRNTLALHWNGSSWSLVSSPNQYNSSGDFNSFQNVAALSSNNVWAVGVSGQESVGLNKQLIAYWNGTSWSIIPPPVTPGNQSELYGVAGLSANDVWAVGDWRVANSPTERYGHTLVEHWDGTKWTYTATPNATVSTNILYSAAPVSADEVWVVGTGGEAGTLIEHGIVQANAVPSIDAITASPNPVRINTSTSISASFTDGDTTDTHIATIDWGDGSATQSGTVTENNGSGTVTGTHTYTALGSHTVTVTVTDAAGVNATGTTEISVIPATGLIGGNISGADYSGANLSGQNMLAANARGTNFTGANLSNANLMAANLRDANFTNANLTNANLIGANLRNANFTGANLTGVNLLGANVTGAIWSNTICPNGTNSNTHNNSCAGQGGGL